MDELLVAEQAELLPAREVMSFFNLTLVSARNRATAVQALTLASVNAASANQGVIVVTS